MHFFAVYKNTIELFHFFWGMQWRLDWGAPTGGDWRNIWVHECQRFLLIEHDQGWTAWWEGSEEQKEAAILLWPKAVWTQQGLPSVARAQAMGRVLRIEPLEILPAVPVTIEREQWRTVLRQPGGQGAMLRGLWEEKVDLIEDYVFSENEKGVQRRNLWRQQYREICQRPHAHAYHVWVFRALEQLAAVGLWSWEDEAIVE